MSLALAQDIVPAATPADANAARARLKALGVDQFRESRLAQLYHALTNEYSIWFCRSDAEKQDISADIVAVLGKVPKIDTMASLSTKEARRAEKKAANAPKTRQRKAEKRAELDLSFIKDDRLRELLLARLPHRPWCCDEFVGNSPRSLEVALTRKYIQINPPGFSSFLIVDIDRVGAADAWQRAGLPKPTWITENPVNGHAHLVWALLAPVWRNGENQKPARLFDAVQEAFRGVLQGCDGFAGLLTKNPASDAWLLSSESNFTGYDLSHLATFVKLSGKGKKKRQESIGRNCCIFDELRHWAYTAIRRYDDPLTFGASVAGHAERLNASLASPMLSNEVLHIARSVTKWTWKHMHLNLSGNSSFASKQAERGRKSGEARRAKNAGLREQAIQLARDFWLVREIARELSVNPSTVSRWLSGVSL